MYIHICGGLCANTNLRYRVLLPHTLHMCTFTCVRARVCVCVCVCVCACFLPKISTFLELFDVILMIR